MENDSMDWQAFLTTWRDSEVSGTVVNRLLDKLQYADMLARHDHIPRAFKKTFEWIFHEPCTSDKAEAVWSSFRGWLSNGSDTYWISGKAGSGKSTLMKMIYHDARTEALLSEWCQGKPLVTAAFFFWNSGSKLQMSQEGFLRSIIYQALEQRQRIMAKTTPLPSTWDAFALSLDYSEREGREGPWKWEDLTQALRFLMEEDEQNLINYAFFIDGLDEFDGDKSKLLSLLHRLGTYPNIKLCVSSRAWVEFEDAFKQKSNLLLQHRTRRDIRRYVKQNLTLHPAFRELRHGNPAYASKLMDDITSKASGVFLWVVLVVRSLLEGLTEGDRISDLQRRLDDIPGELNDLFKKMLGTLRPALFKHSSQIFQIFRAAKTKPSILTLSFADEEDGEYCRRRECGPLSAEETYYRAVTMCRRLNSRCKGLLEVSHLPHWRLVLGKDPFEPNSDDDDDDNDEDANVKEFAEDVTRNRSSPGSLADSMTEESRRQWEQHLANSTVQYMHRTVKDFMSIPEVWAFIMSGSGENFMPNACLCQSFILQLKTLSSASLLVSDGPFWEKILWALEYAVRVADTSLESHVWLLDSLNQAAASVSQAGEGPRKTLLSKYKLSESSHWSGILSKRAEEVGFLPFAVRCHLTQYVKAKLRAHHNADNKIYTELLHIAVSSSGIPFLYRKGAFPEVDLVKALLEGGASPNQKIEGSSSWQYVLRSIDSDDGASWQPIREAFELYSLEPLLTHPKTLDLVPREHHGAVYTPERRWDSDPIPSGGLYDLVGLNRSTDVIHDGMVLARDGTLVSIDKGSRVSLNEIDSDEDVSLPSAYVVSQAISNMFPYQERPSKTSQMTDSAAPANPQFLQEAHGEDAQLRAQISSTRRPSKELLKQATTNNPGQSLTWRTKAKSMLYRTKVAGSP
jgi:AraC-like DNA-binding protein